MTFNDLERPKRNPAGKNRSMEQQLGFFFSLTLSFTSVHTYLYALVCLLSTTITLVVNNAEVYSP